MDYDEDYDYDELAVRLTDAVSIALECAYEKSELSVGILDYFVSLGIQISDLIDTALELMDCEKTDKIKETLPPKRQVNFHVLPLLSHDCPDAVHRPLGADAQYPGGKYSGAFPHGGGAGPRPGRH